MHVHRCVCAIEQTSATPRGRVMWVPRARMHRRTVRADPFLCLLLKYQAYPWMILSKIIPLVVTSRKITNAMANVVDRIINNDLVNLKVF